MMLTVDVGADSG